MNFTKPYFIGKFNGMVCDYDYDNFVIPTESEALSQFQNAQQLIAEAEQKRAKLISGDLSLPEIP